MLECTQNNTVSLKIKGGGVLKAIEKNSFRAQRIYSGSVYYIIIVLLLIVVLLCSCYASHATSVAFVAVYIVAYFFK